MSGNSHHFEAFSVLFKDLDRWDPSSFKGIQWNWPKVTMRPIRSFLKPRKQKVDRSKYSFKDLQPITIHFDGSIEKRKVPNDREYTMALFLAYPGDIVVAKIDLKNGAVGVLPDWQLAVVTGHFAVYEPDRTKIIPEYFRLLIQAKFFKEHLWRNKVGAEGRKEVKLDFFEAQEIPLPPLHIQEAIAEHWQQARSAAAKSREIVARLESEIQGRIISFLGLKKRHAALQSVKAFALTWKHLERWSVEYLARNVGVARSHGFPRRT